MAQHKAPTAVTVAPLQERSGIGLWITKYWPHIAVVVLGIVAWMVWRDRQRAAVLAVRDTSWQRLAGKVERDPVTLGYKGDPNVLAALATDLKDTAAGPSVRLVEVEARLRARDYAGALAALDQLIREHPTHPYVTESYAFGAGRNTLLGQLRSTIAAQQSFEEAHPGLYANPPLPADSPRVRVTTDQGAFVLGLYEAEAPEHVKNFLKLCREGFYVDTKFHRVVRDSLIQGGDPNSREGDPATWGQGGTDYKLAPEPNRLFHFAGVLAAAKRPGEPQSSGSQFYVTTGSTHQFDGQYTIYGTVVEGMDVVLKINQAETAPSSERPLAPAKIVSTEVL